MFASLSPHKGIMEVVGFGPWSVITTALESVAYWYVPITPPTLFL